MTKNQMPIDATSTESQERFAQLLIEAGIMPKEQEIFSPEQRVEKIRETLDLLQMAKEMKNEKEQKRLRRYLRTKLQFKISEHLRVEIK